MHLPTHEKNDLLRSIMSIACKECHIRRLFAVAVPEMASSTWTQSGLRYSLRSPFGYYEDYASFAEFKDAIVRDVQVGTLSKWWGWCSLRCAERR